MSTALAEFHPLIARWFNHRYPQPTDAQTQSWPLIAAGENVLITAPTGSGKTLTAFLWAINQFCRGEYEAGATSVLYVSPLKALNTDIRRNLLTPLSELAEHFAAEQQAFPAVRVETRSGDTPSEERARMLRRPPEILITTPESLNLLLTTPSGRKALATVRCVILDEIHALLDSRRGTHLMTAVERVVLEAGEVQRIALSATVNPLAAVAQWVAGYRHEGERHAPRYEARAVRIVQSQDRKRIDLRVEAPSDARAGDDYWQPVADTLKHLSTRNRSTLAFTNSRRMAERLTSRVNADLPSPLAYAHHGSLSREIRGEVERRMKAGELKTIVATSSLEMGIDIGELDQVVLVQSPPDIAGTIQRIGRAGHQVGAVSQALLIPTYGHDLITAAALTQCIGARELEPAQPLDAPLDVLAQIIVSMCVQQHWQLDDLFNTLRCAAPYHRLQREHFDLVIQMLTGRYASTKIRSLQPKLAHDVAEGTVTARKGATLALYTAGGTIPNRGYYTLRHFESNAPIGELDEEFVWERRIGELFSLGTQSWRIHGITHNDVFVEPNRSTTLAPPFWRAEGQQRNHFLSLRIAELLERFDHEFATRRGKEKLRDQLIAQHQFDETAAERLLDFLTKQRDVTEAPLPHRHHLLIEHVHSGPSGYQGPDRDKQVVLHTLWGARVNRPYGIALAAAWEKRFGEAPELHVADDVIVLQVAQDHTAGEFLHLVDLGNLEPLLRESLETSAFFGARFRECAGRALLLAPRRFNQRQPLWMTRLQAKQLMAEVASKPDFPMLLETWRTCLQDEFDLVGLRDRMQELADGAIATSECTTSVPSPFADQVTFDQINRYMYADDTPTVTGRSDLSDSILGTLTQNSALRPTIRLETIKHFEERRQRLAPGYTPSDAGELVEWIRERVWLTEDHWQALLSALQRDGHADAIAEASQKLARLRTSAGSVLVCARDVAGVLVQQLFEGATAFTFSADPFKGLTSDERDGATLLSEAMVFFGPKSLAQWQTVVPIDAAYLSRLLSTLTDDETALTGTLTVGAPAMEWCDVDVYESLLRIQRALSRSTFVARPLTQLPAFLAQWQRFGGIDVEHALTCLEGFSAPVAHFEASLLPARIASYQPHSLDELLRTEAWLWRGGGEGRVQCVSSVGAQLVNAKAHPQSLPFPAIAPGLKGRFSYFELQDFAADSAADSAGKEDDYSELFWQAVWRGELTADDFAPLRAGLKQDFALPSRESTTPSASPPMAARLTLVKRSAKTRARGWPGLWRQLSPTTAPDNPIDELEQSKDRVRLLVGRYGVLCRDLLANEPSTLSWRNHFRTIRLMEFSGELISGHFFEELSSPQFIDPGALRRLELGPTPGIFAISAVDPISPCGLVRDTAAWLTELPRRAFGNDLVFHDDCVVIVSTARGKHLNVLVAADDANLVAYLEALAPLLRYDTHTEIQTINATSSLMSPYLPALRNAFEVTSDHRAVFLHRKQSKQM